MENIDEKTLKKVFMGLFDGYAMTAKTLDEVKNYVNGGAFNDFSKEALKELSDNYKYISMMYRTLSNGKYLPNIFIKMED